MDRKEAKRQYKERKAPPRGICAVRCTATGRAWVGHSTNLDALQTRLWFTLRLGSHNNPGLQAEWNAHGEQVFRYEVLETLEESVTKLEEPDLLKERTRHWIAELGADPLVR